MFETSDDQSKPELRPLRVASRKEGIYDEVKTMVGDLAHWRVVSSDDSACVVTCERRGGLLGKDARVTIRVEGPEGIPSATVIVRVDGGGLFASEKSVAAEFLKPFARRVG